MKFLRNARSATVCVLVLVLSLLPFTAGAVTAVDTIRLVTTASGSGGDDTSRETSISADGTKIAFVSRATDLLATPTTSQNNIFVYDVASGETTLVTTGPGNGGNGYCWDPQISADGSTIAFISWASDLLATPTTSQNNIFVYDVASGETTLVTKGPGSGGNVASRDPRLSADGSTIVFYSYATNLLATPTTSRNTFVYDVATGVTTLVSAGPGNGGNGFSGDASISADGTKIAFVSRATDLLATPTTGNGNVFVYDVATGETTLVTTGPGNGGNSYCWEPRISADGSTITFISWATDLLATPTTSGSNVFVYDVASGETTLVTTGPGNGGNSYCWDPQISADGSTITFISWATDLLATPTTGSGNVFVYDVATGEANLVTTGPGNGGNDESYGPRISADGTTIAFTSDATDLTADLVSNHRNVFVYDVTSDSVMLLSKSPSVVDRGSNWPSISANGRTIAFSSGISDFPGAETEGGRANIFLWTREFTVDVTFEANNGSSPAIETITQGTAVAAPDPAPQRDGFVFNGWYTAEGVLWNFNNPISADMTLYAHWLELFTVTFDAQNGTNPLVVEDVVEGSILTMPTDPTKVGYTFAGWWTDPAGGALWDFALDVVTESMTLYGHWTPVEDGGNGNGNGNGNGGGAGGTTPDTSDSAALLPVLTSALLGCVVVGTTLYRRRFEH